MDHSRNSSGILVVLSSSESPHSFDINQFQHVVDPATSPRAFSPAPVKLKLKASHKAAKELSTTLVMVNILNFLEFDKIFQLKSICRNWNSEIIPHSEYYKIYKTFTTKPEPTMVNYQEWGPKREIDHIWKS